MEWLKLLAPTVLFAFGFYMRDRDRAQKEESRTQLLNQRIDQIEKKLEREFPAMIDAALNKWELGFRERLSGWVRNEVRDAIKDIHR